MEAMQYFAALIVLGAALCLPGAAMAQDGTAPRWPYPDGVVEAYNLGDFATAQASLEAELGRCIAAAPPADQCLDLVSALANIARLAGKAVAAERYAHQSIAIAEEFLGEGDFEASVGYHNLALSLDAQGRYADAKPLHERALTTARLSRPADHIDIAEFLDASAANLERLAAFRQAEGQIRDALEIRENALPADDPRIATGYLDLADNLKAQKRYGEAETLFRRSLDMFGRVVPDGDLLTAEAWFGLAETLEYQGRAAEATAPFRTALSIRERRLPADHRLIAQSKSGLALNLSALGQNRLAEVLIAQAIASGEKTLPPEHPDLIAFRNSLAIILNALGREADAERVLRECLAAGRRYWTREHPNRIAGAWNLANFLSRRAAGEGEARSLFREAEGGVLRRIETFRDFGEEARQELRHYRPIFTDQVRIAWMLARKPAKR